MDGVPSGPALDVDTVANDSNDSNSSNSRKNRRHHVSDMVRLAIDFENPSPEWWENGGRDLWDAILEGFDNNDAVVDRSIADSWLAEAAKLPGWEGGPVFSPPPVCIKEVDEDGML